MASDINNRRNNNNNNNNDNNDNNNQDNTANTGNIPKCISKIAIRRLLSKPSEFF